MQTKQPALADQLRAYGFHIGLFIVMAALFAGLVWRGPSGDVVEQDTPPAGIAQQETTEGKAATRPAIQIFFSPTCPHCHKALAFLDGLQKRTPDLVVKKYDVSRASSRNLMQMYLQHFNLMGKRIGVPFIVMGEKHLVGFNDAATTGNVIESWVRRTDGSGKIQSTEDVAEENLKNIQVPFLGEVNALDMSLPALAIVLGLVDGFNPCAMWVLVYLISLIVGLKDRTKIYTLVGTFLAASGILYFLFMTAWLNVFLYIGYIHPLTVLIGVAALYMGILSVYDFIKSGGEVICKVGDISARQKTQTRIRDLVAAPLTWATFGGIVILAFAVNSIEFVCSAAMPAVFTQVLALSDISTLSYYLYILLYVLCFMFDDLVIFTLAALAAERFAGEKYAGFCKLIGGILMCGLGVVLAFFPELLR